MILKFVLFLICLRCIVSIDDILTVTVNPITVGYPIASDFASFSYEVACVPILFTFNNQSRTSFVNLMNNLRTAAGGSRGPNIRIGGNSADDSVFLPPNQPLPINDTYRIQDSDFQAYLLTVPLFNGTITPGVNFRNSTDPSLAIAHINALSSIIPWSSGLVESIEIGNECDVYYQNGIRPPNYIMNNYITDFDMYQKAIQFSTTIPYPKIQGATFCCRQTTFDAGLPAYIQQYSQSKVLNTISYHEYPLGNCNKKNELTIYDLLANTAVDRNIPHLTPFIQAAQAAGIPFYIGEGNSISCGGMLNVSNVFASALWFADSLFTHAAAFVQRYNIHGCYTQSSIYSAITYPNLAVDIPDVHPLYYGMWVFATATAHNAIIYNTTIQSTNDLIKVWITRDAMNSTWYITAIHKDVNQTENAIITVSFPSGTVNKSIGKLQRLFPINGSPYATSGLLFGGLTFDGSTDGKPTGTPVSDNVNPNNDGSYTFTVNPTSIAVVSIPTS